MICLNLRKYFNTEAKLNAKLLKNHDFTANEIESLISLSLPLQYQNVK